MAAPGTVYIICLLNNAKIHTKPLKVKQQSEFSMVCDFIHKLSAISKQLSG